MNGFVPAGLMKIQKVGANKNESNEGRCRVSLEVQFLAQKSSRTVPGKTADWNEIVKDRTAFANAMDRIAWDLVQSSGRTQATRSFVNPSLLRNLNFTGGSTLKHIEPHPLLALIVEELSRYSGGKNLRHSPAVLTRNAKLKRVAGGRATAKKGKTVPGRVV